MPSDQPEQKLHIFFALWPDSKVRSQLAAWQPPLRDLCGGTPMRAETLHNTLVFLGDVVAHRLEALKLAAQEVVGESFELRLSEARYWGHNHIVYAAPSMVPPQLVQIVHGLEQRLRQHRFHFEPRDYKPHVTLLRHAKWQDEPLPSMPAVAWTVHDFALVRSLSDETGARYEVLERFPLGQR